MTRPTNSVLGYMLLKYSVGGLHFSGCLSSVKVVSASATTFETEEPSAEQRAESVVIVGRRLLRSMRFTVFGSRFDRKATVRWDSFCSQRIL